jgi:SAM-dependent methyltransferase
VFEAESIDLVTSRFGVMFFADPVVAFANLHGALRRGGRLTFVCWQPLGENAWMRIPLMAAAPLLPELPPPPEPGAPGPFAFGDDALVRRILADAGFENIELVPHGGTLALGGSASLEDGVDFVLRLGPTARLLANADDELLRGVREAVTKAVEPFATDEGIAMDYATWLVSAKRS